jgi:hypothetical protein
MTAQSQFDLGPIDTRPLSEEGVWMPVLRVDNGLPLIVRDTPVKLKMAGPDGTLYARVQRDMVQTVLKAREEGKTIDETKASIDMLAHLVLDWTGIFYTNGEPVPFSYDNVVTVLTAMPPMVAQADRFQQNRANFIAPPSST